MFSASSIVDETKSPWLRAKVMTCHASEKTRSASAVLAGMARYLTTTGIKSGKSVR